jgi:hypothetical protein
MDFERENNDSACAEIYSFPKPRIMREDVDKIKGTRTLDESFDLHIKLLSNNMSIPPNLILSHFPLRLIAHFF